MFTIQDIDAAHASVKSGADFPRYVQAIKTLGVQRYESFVNDGHTEYVGANGYSLQSEAKHPLIPVADAGNPEQFLARLAAHQRGETDYFTFREEAAAAGVEKWVVDIQAMTCTYYDKEQNTLLEETIPSV